METDRLTLHLGRHYPFEHTKNNHIFKWMIYEPVRNLGEDFEYLTGVIYVIIPLAMLCTGENILTYKEKMVIFNDSSKILTKISCKIWVSQVHRTVCFCFCFFLNNCLLKLCAQKYSPNCTIPVSNIQNFSSL